MYDQEVHRQVQFNAESPSYIQNAHHHKIILRSQLSPSHPMVPSTMLYIKQPCVLKIYFYITPVLIDLAPNA